MAYGIITLLQFKKIIEDFFPNFTWTLALDSSIDMGSTEPFGHIEGAEMYGVFVSLIYSLKFTSSYFQLNLFLKYGIIFLVY